MHQYISIVILCIMAASELKGRHLRLAANRQEGRKIDVGPFYMSWLVWRNNPILSS